jgi:hypothetical protein
MHLWGLEMTESVELRGVGLFGRLWIKGVVNLGEICGVKSEFVEIFWSKKTVRCLDLFEAKHEAKTTV